MGATDADAVNSPAVADMTTQGMIRWRNTKEWRGVKCGEEYGEIRVSRMAVWSPF